MSTVITSDRHYKKMANVVRIGMNVGTKFKPKELAQGIAGLSNPAFKPSELTNAVMYSDGIPIIVGDKMYPGMFAGQYITKYKIPDNITKIANGAFINAEIGSNIFHDNITEIGDRAFWSAEWLIDDVVLPPNLVSIGSSAFFLNKPTTYYGIKKITIPESVNSIGSSAFQSNYYFNVIEFLGVVAIPSSCFGGHHTLRALVLRNETAMCSLENINAFQNTPIVNSSSYFETGTSYIYVPTSLLESYKTAEKWSTFASQFRALEEYTVDGTITGELDKSKL